MILRDEPEFTIECEADDDRSQAIADTLVGVFSKYSLDTNDSKDPVGIDADGIEFIIRYKKFDA